MYDKIVEHALNNVWCNLEQDKQHILLLHRISQKTGVLNRIALMMGTVNLPAPRQRYMVYQIGHVHPSLLNLLTKQPEWQVGVWVSVSECMNICKNLTVDIYNDAGVQIPRFHSYYMLTADGTLLFCFKRNNLIPVNYLLDKFYVRFYSNAYFRTPAFDTANNFISTTGFTYTSSEEFIRKHTEYAKLTKLPGMVSVYKNGMLIKDLSLIYFKLNDVCEWVYDSSVELTVDIPVSEMPRFESQLDKTSKQLFHYKPAGQSPIRYMDDVDFYLCGKGPDAKMYGVYYHKNLPSAVRMVTHCDYALLVQNIVNHTLGLQEAAKLPTLNQQNSFVRAVIRKSGYNRPLVYDRNRIFELYKLSEDRIEQAMVGVNSTVPVWKAQNLENSEYCKLMRSYAGDVTRNMAERCYGYNGLTKILADTPLLVPQTGAKQVSVPIGLRLLSTAFEYNKNGLLTGYYTHDNSDVYLCRNTNTKYVEMLPGEGTHAVDITYSKKEIDLPKACSYRVYIHNDISDKVVDITETQQYQIVGDKIVCDQTLANAHVVVKTDKKFLCYKLNTPTVEGMLYFTFSQMEDRGDGLKHHVMDIPWRYWDIFLNGRLLTEGIDYAVDFPKVVIWHKKYLKLPEDQVNQNIVVRAAGFCKKDLSWVKPDMTGFINHGMLLNNNKFDIKDDKVQLITVDGCVKHKSEVKFGDEHSGVSIINTINGLPYRINNTYIPVSSQSLNGTDVLLEEAELIDKQVSNYLTLLLPEPKRDAVSAIYERYVLYSPFISRILEALSEGDHDTDLGAAALTDGRIVEICSAYEHLLKVDPTQPEAGIDEDYVLIHPTVRSKITQLTLLQYRFLRRVVELYCHDRVQLSDFVTFS